MSFAEATLARFSKEVAKYPADQKQSAVMACLAIVQQEQGHVSAESEKLVAEFPITPGSKTLPAPIGVWKILGIATMPWFRHDEGVLMHGVRTDDFYNIPPGPNNPVGILWMGLNKPGIGIHGTNNPETIGRASSHGCIRTANWDAARLKDLVSPGTTVTIF